MNELIIDYIPAKGEGSAQVRVVCRPESGADQESDPIDFSFEMSDDDRRLVQWYMEDYLSYPYAAFVDRAKKAEELMRQMGEELFDAVFSDRRSITFYSKVEDDLADCRITVRVSDPVGRSLPWELMRDPGRGYLAQKAYSFVRSRPNVPVMPVKLDLGQTINILMIISRPGGKTDVRFQSVARPLLEIFRQHRDRINLEILRPPTFPRLAEVLNKKPGFYHVIHFDGHGRFAKRAGGERYYAGESEGFLSFEEEDGGSSSVSARDLGGLLSAKNVPVVMLNACQSGMTDPETEYPALGDELLNAGVRGVVAMAYSVYVPTAAKFMGCVYGMLVEGTALDRAVSAGREILASDTLRESPLGPIPMQDWPVPVIFQSGDVRLFTPGGEKLHLDLGAMEGEQEKAGTEIGLPEPPDFGFIGRDSLMLDMETGFRKETIVLLRGMAGMGKSTAAVGFARWWAETGALGGPIFFFDFQQYVPLARVCDSIGSVFGRSVKEQLGEEWHLLDPEKRRELALQILKQIPCLMIWDNFETVSPFSKADRGDLRTAADSPASLWTQEERDELRSFLRSLRGGRTKVIITSRRDEDWLGKCYRLIETGGLSILESTELAGKVLDNAGVDRKKLKPYRSLLNYLGGNPLAIQVIMPELKNVSPDRLLPALKSGQAKIEDDESLGRSGSLTASLNYRLDHLSPDLRKKLSILGLFQGFVNANVPAAICQDDDAPEAIKGLDRAAWDDMLESARELGLLSQMGQGLYRIHPALPWFFRGAMEEGFPGEREKLERIFCRTCGAYGYQLFKLFETSAQVAMTFLRLEEPNLTHALRLARRYEDWDSVQRVLYGLCRLMNVDGRWTEWGRIVSDVETDAIGDDGEPLYGRELLWTAVVGHKARIAGDRRDFSEASRLHQKLLQHYQTRAGDQWQDKEKDELTAQEISALRNAAVAFHQIGNIASQRRQFDESGKWYRSSLEIEEKIGDEHDQAKTLHQLGYIAQERQQFDEAEDWYSRSLAIKKKIGDEHGQAYTLHQLGNIAYTQHKFDEAEEWHRRGLEIDNSIGDEHSQAKTLHLLGMIAQERRQFDEAEKWYRRSLEIEEKIGDEHDQAKTLHNLGAIAQERRQFDEAEGWYRRSLEIEEKIGDEYGQATTLHQLGMVAELRGQFDDAEEWYRRGLEITERIGDEQGQAQTLHQLGVIAQFRGQFDDAEDWYRKSLSIEEKIADEHGQAATLHQLGVIAEERGQFDEALAFYLKAEGIFKRMDDPYHLDMVWRALERVKSKE